MSPSELEKLIQTLREVGSDVTHIEAKRSHRELPRQLWETLSAFANTPGGGVVVLGLDESHGFETVGVQDPAKLQADLASLCDQMEPPLRALIQVHPFEQQQIVTAEIPEVSYQHKPCHYRGSGLMTGSFIRVADGDRQLTQYEIQVFLDSRGQPTYDGEPVASSRPEDLNPDLLNLFLNHLRSRPEAPYRDWEEARLLRSFRILTEYEGKIVPTLAGILCFGVYPQEVFPGLHLCVVRYPTPRPGEPGPRGERLLDNVKVEGSLVDLLQKTMSTLLRHLQRRTIISGLLREDLWEYPLETLREAIVNALGHRDYSPLARGTPTQIRLFPDRLEVESPGGLFGAVTAERLGEPGLLASRNAHLMRLLEDLPVPTEGRMICENRGTGIVALLEALRRAGMEPATFTDRHTTFKVTLSNATLLDQEMIQWLHRFSERDLTETQRLALAYTRRNSRLTHAEYRRLNPGLDSPAATRELAALVEQGLLTQHGTRRWAFYNLSPQATTPISTRIPSQETSGKEDLEEQILAYVREKGSITNAECRLLLGLGEDIERARYLLSRLHQQSRLRRVGSKRGSRYELPQATSSQ